MYVSLPDDPPSRRAAFRVIRTELLLRGCPSGVFDCAFPELKRLMENAPLPTDLVIRPGASSTAVSICLSDVMPVLDPRSQALPC